MAGAAARFGLRPRAVHADPGNRLSVPGAPHRDGADPLAGPHGDRARPASDAGRGGVGVRGVGDLPGRAAVLVHQPVRADERLADHRRPRFRRALRPGRRQVVPGAEPGVGPADRRTAGQPAQGRGQARSPSSRTGRWWASPARRRSSRPTTPATSSWLVCDSVAPDGRSRGAVTGDGHRDRRHARPVGPPPRLERVGRGGAAATAKTPG